MLFPAGACLREAPGHLSEQPPAVLNVSYPPLPVCAARVSAAPLTGGLCYAGLPQELQELSADLPIQEVLAPALAALNGSPGLVLEAPPGKLAACMWATLLCTNGTSPQGCSADQVFAGQWESTALRRS